MQYLTKRIVLLLTFCSLVSMTSTVGAVNVSEDAAGVRIVVSVDKSVSAKDIIIDLEDGVLHAVVEKPERIEIVVEEQWLTFTAERRSEGQGSFSASYASQQLTLPSVVDVSTVKADLTDGTLTLTFQKNPEKNRQRIQVTQGGGKPLAGKSEKLKDK